MKASWQKQIELELYNHPGDSDDKDEITTDNSDEAPDEGESKLVLL